MDRQTDFTPRSVPAIVLISLALGLLFGGLTLEVAYRNSAGLSAQQQQDDWAQLNAFLDAYAELQLFYIANGRWPDTLSEVTASGMRTEAFTLTDGLGGSFRYETAKGDAVLTSDGLDRRRGGKGDGVDVVLRVPPPVGGELTSGRIDLAPASIGTRWQFLRFNAPTQMLAGAAATGLLLGGLVLLGAVSDRRWGWATSDPSAVYGWIRLLGMGAISLTGMTLAASVIGLVMALVHGWAGPH